MWRKGKVVVLVLGGGSQTLLSCLLGGLAPLSSRSSNGNFAGGLGGVGWGRGAATVAFRLQIMALIQVTVQRCIAAQDRPAKSTSGDSTKVSRPLNFFFSFWSEAGRGPCERERRVAQSQLN